MTKESVGWALLLTPGYRKPFKLLPPKYQSQISRKVQDLASNPREGGSKMAVKSLKGIYRLRAGNFRIFYNFNETVVQLLLLSRRDDHTYDGLDHLEQEALQSYAIGPAPEAPAPLPSWHEAAKKWTAPKPPVREPLPAPIDDSLLAELEIDPRYHAELKAMRFVEDLLGCESIPNDDRMNIVDALVSQSADAVLEEGSHAVVVAGDLIDPAKADFAGRLFAQQLPISPELDGPTQLPLPLVVNPALSFEQPIQARVGNTSWGVGAEAVYVVKLNGSVQLTYTANAGERVLLTVDGHDELVAMVNKAKRAGGATQNGGRFVINEHRQVLVPTINAGVMVAGVYTRDLEFMLDGELVSPVAPAGISAGDIWPGPHVGIRYTLAAGATDIRYETRATDGESVRVLLSDECGREAIAGLLEMCRKVRPQGGALYVNEARELFTPAEVGDRYERVYIGPLAGHPWFSPVQ